MEAFDKKVQELVEWVGRDVRMERALYQALLPLEGSAADGLFSRLFGNRRMEGDVKPLDRRYDELERKLRDLSWEFARGMQHFRALEDLCSQLPSGHGILCEPVQKIEIELAEKMIHRMIMALRRVGAAEISPFEGRFFEAALSSNPRSLVAWVHALGHGDGACAHGMMRLFGRAHRTPPVGFRDHVQEEVRQGRALQRAVSRERKAFLAESGYEALEGAMRQEMDAYLFTLFGYAQKQISSIEEQYYVTAAVLDSRERRHYALLIPEFDHLLASQILSMNLREKCFESSEVQSESLERVHAFERSLFERMTRRVSACLSDFFADDLGFTRKHGSSADLLRRV